MSKYTINLKTVCEAYAGVKSPAVWESPSVVMGIAAPKVFDFEWPIFDESYREHLELMILRRYYTRELCCQEVGRWKMFLEQRLNEIMPKYNPMYKAMLLDFNPFYDVDYIDEHSKNVKDDETVNKTDTGNEKGTRSSDVQSSGNTDTDSTLTRTGTVTQSGTVQDQGTTSDNSTRTDNLHEWNRYSDTPQGALTNVQNDTYLSEARGIDNTGTQENESSGTSSNTQTTDMTNTNNLTDSTTGNTTSNAQTQTTDNTTKDTSKQSDTTRGATTVEEYLQKVQGKRGNSSYARLLAEYRQLFVSVDTMVLDELADLFMNIW